jgi:hypothetical protein
MMLSFLCCKNVHWGLEPSLSSDLSPIFMSSSHMMLSPVSVLLKPVIRRLRYSDTKLERLVFFPAVELFEVWCVESLFECRSYFVNIVFV